MSRVKTIKLILFFAALVFVAKPFVGFSLSGHLKSPVKTNIFVKVFSKRKIEDARSIMSAIQKHLATPLTNLFLRFSFLLTILFPLAFKPDNEITAGFLNQLQLRLVPMPVSMFTGQLLI